MSKVKRPKNLNTDKSHLQNGPKSSPTKMQIALSTYIFQEWSLGKGKYHKYPGFYPVLTPYRETEFWAFPGLKTRVHQIFQHAENSRNPKLQETSASRHKYEVWFDKYFRHVLAWNPFELSEGLQIDKCRLILSEETFCRISQLIQDYKLDKHSDFIFLLISRMQKKYLEQIEYYESEEEVNRVRKFPQQIQLLIKILELTDKDTWDWKNGDRPQLKKVVFKFKNVKPHTLVIEDSNLLSYIPDAIREYHSKGSFKNWKKQLEVYPYGYSENEKNRSFRFRIAKALHELFISEKIFIPRVGKKSKDDEIKCIARMMEFAHIPIKDKKGNIKDAAIDGDVIRMVRGWVSRKRK